MSKQFQKNICSNVISTGKICEDIAKVAISHGYESYIAYGRLSKPSVSNEIRIGSTIETYGHYAEHRLFDREGLASRFATKRLIKQIDNIKPDIIHLHNIHDHYLNYPLLFRYLATIDIPVVWTQHDCWAFTGGCMYFDMSGCEQWKSGCLNCKEKRALLGNKAAYQFETKKALLSNIKNLIFVPVSDWLHSLLEQSVQQSRPIITIHNGVDLTIFRPMDRTNNLKLPKFKILGVAAIWDARKGLVDFVELRSKLSEDYEITLIGLTPKQISSLPKGINGIQRTQNVEELVQLYSDANVFLNPTYSDNFPTTNIEALACGTPVITYRTGGSPEAVDKKTGIVVEQGDVNGLVEAIYRMKKEPLSSADCRKRAEDYFEKDKCFEKYIELYNSLI
ncbi:MAG: glycosyltransferase [Mollicutes bacterium]|nr:glycosyltransferase [Mollicutes bacterium]